MTFNLDHSNPQLTYSSIFNILDELDLSRSKSDILQKNLIYFENKNFYKTDSKTKTFILAELDENGRRFISDDVILSLGHCLKDYSSAVRDAAINSLGCIGLPEGLLVLDSILEVIKDEEASVKSKAIWTIGKLAKGCDTQVIK